MPPDSLRQAMWLGERVPRFKALTSHPLFPAIHGRLVAGLSPYRLAYWIQDKVAPDDPLGPNALLPASLARKLQRYRRHLPKASFLPSSFVEELVHGAEIDIDVLQELAGLIVLQRERLTMAHEIERQMQLPMEQARREVQTMADLLLQMRDTQIALGYPGWSTTAPGIPMATDIPLHIQESPLERFLTQHPEHVADVLPFLRKLDEIGFDPEFGKSGS